MKDIKKLVKLELKENSFEFKYITAHQLQSVPGYVVLYEHSIGCWRRAEGGDGIATQSLSGEKHECYQKAFVLLNVF